MSSITIRFKAAELDLDADGPAITRMAVDYDLTVGKETISKTWSAAPTVSQEGHLWRLLREILDPMLSAEGLEPPALLRPELPPAFGRMPSTPMDSDDVTGEAGADLLAASALVAD